MRRLIIDSGGTHSTWILLHDGVVIESSTRSGFSVLHDSWHDFPKRESDNPTEVYFFGSACIETIQEKTKIQLQQIFPDAIIHAGSDLEAVAYAAAGDQEACIHIIGTGSAVNVWDGLQFKNPIVNLGFLWEDYASGYDIGKTIIQYWKEHRLDPIDSELLQQEIGNLDSFIVSLYQEKNFKTKLSSLSPLLDQLQAKTKEKIIDERLDIYFTKNINIFEPQMIHHFNGTLAKLYEDSIRQKAKIYNRFIGKVMANPKQGLIDYFLEK